LRQGTSSTAAAVGGVVRLGRRMCAVNTMRGLVKGAVRVAGRGSRPRAFAIPRSSETELVCSSRLSCHRSRRDPNRPNNLARAPARTLEQVDPATGSRSMSTTWTP
jgi:hypothetical protein